MVIYWATKLRGFLRHMSQHMQDISFLDKGQYYEVAGLRSKVASKLIRSPLLDPIGLFQILKVSGKDCDYYGSFNRFLQADKPYFIYLENPTALYHYTLGRLRFPAGKKRFQKCLNDPNLRYIVCMSDACRSTFEKINMPLPEHVKLRTIHPFVPQNHYADEESVRGKCFAPVLECLYCVQGKSFYTKGGRDILNAVARLQDSGLRIHLTVITNLEALEPDTLELLRSRENMTLHDFTFSYQEMEQVYAKTALLLQPSSADSCPLTVLEAIKGGCAVLGSKLYAIPEMVSHGENGVLIDPKYWTFFPDHMPNPAAWGQKNKHRLMRLPSEKYSGDIEQAIRELYEDRGKLFDYALHAKQIADSKFGEDTICDQWQEVWDALKGFDCDEV